MAVSLTPLLDGIRRGDMRAIARAIRLIDDRDPIRVPLLSALHERTGRAQVIGVTGSPGAGKSSVVDCLIQAHRKSGRTVGVIAVDPTSPFSGGAILGDRIRMQRHFLDDGVFIRSIATRGNLGGLSRSASEIIRVLDAAGFQIVIVETVGVGQDELDVARLAHTTIVVTAPGMGDDIQAIKAGILEVADVFAVNKADRDGAATTVRDLEQMIALGEMSAGPKSGRGHAEAASMMKPRRDHPDQWTPPVVRTVATMGEGIDELVAACAAHGAFLRDTEAGKTQLQERRREEFRRLVRDELMQALEVRIRWEDAERAVLRGEDPYERARQLIEQTLSDVQN